MGTNGQTNGQIFTQYSGISSHSRELVLWEFKDVVDDKGIPRILMCDQWECMLPLLTHRMFFLDDIELLFLNQVSNNCFTSFFV